MKEGIQGCQQQILATPVGQQFLHVLREGLVMDFCKSPAMMEPPVELFEKSLEEGCQFLLRKYGLEDTGGAAELGKMLYSLSDPLEMLGGDLSLPLGHPWWLPAMTRAATLFTTSSFIDLSLPGWREFLYPVVPLPKEWLPFSEAGTGGVHTSEISENPVLPMLLISAQSHLF